MSKTIPDYVHEHFRRCDDAQPGRIVRRQLVRRQLVCRDGYKLSVQASAGRYCSPREDHAERYVSVEVGYPHRPDGSGYKPRPFGKTIDRDTFIWSWLPVSTVNRWVHAHGRG